jgi:hypothetical protein
MRLLRAAAAAAARPPGPGSPQTRVTRWSIPRSRRAHRPPKTSRQACLIPFRSCSRRSTPTARGCADVAGDCNAVNAMANIIAGYANRGGPQGNWFLMLAGMPRVTVQQVTDVTGRADAAFRFPFSDGITEIPFNASLYQFAGYVRDGIETVITKEVAVSGPGSLTPVVIHPKPGRVLPARR